MGNAWVIRESRKYLTGNLVDRLNSLEHNVIEMAPDMETLSKYTIQDGAILIFVDQDVLDKQQALIYLRDLAVENEIPVFLMGLPLDIESIKSIIPDSAIEDEFFRPLDIPAIVDEVNQFLSNNNSQVKKKILVVDDSGMMLRNVKKLLGDKYQVILANSGAMAIKYLTLDRPDLMLLDYEMPVINGKQVMEIIRTENDFAGVPVFFITSRNDRETIMDVMGLKPEGYLLKSLSAEDFVRTIDDFFEKRKKIN